MTQEEKQMMNDGVPDTDEHTEAKAAVICFMLFVACGVACGVALGIAIGIIELVKSIIY